MGILFDLHLDIQWNLPVYDIILHYIILQAEAEAALKRDREPLDGRPMFISRCDPDKLSRQPGFKYRTTLEKNKLFVKGEMVNLIV